MKRVTIFLTFCFLALAVVTANWATPVAAVDYDEDQLIAVKVDVYRDNPPGYECVQEPCEPKILYADVYQVNCLLAPGAAYSNATNPLSDIIYFGRTTCNYPVPNLQNPLIQDELNKYAPQADIVTGNVGEQGTVAMYGVATLKHISQGITLHTDNCYPNPPIITVDDSADRCQRASRQYEREDWGVTGDVYKRGLHPNPADVFSVTHYAELVLPDDWEWVSYPSDSCVKTAPHIVICSQESAPFTTPANGGQPPSDRY